MPALRLLSTIRRPWTTLGVSSAIASNMPTTPMHVSMMLML